VACRGNATGGTRVFTCRRQIHPAAPITGGSAGNDGTNPSPEQAHRVGARFVHALARRSRGAIIAGRGHRAISALSFGAYRRPGPINGCTPRCELSAMRSAGSFAPVARYTASISRSAWRAVLRRPARRTGWCGRRRLEGPLTAVPVAVAVVVGGRPGRRPAGLADHGRDRSQQGCVGLPSPTGADDTLSAGAVGALALHGHYRAPIARGFHACAHALRPVERRQVHGPLDPVRLLVERRLAGHARQADLKRPPTGPRQRRRTPAGAGGVETSPSEDGT